MLLNTTEICPIKKDRQHMTVPTDHSTQDSRQLLLKGAEELFARHGFDGTSIRLIAKELHMNSGMISYYFGSKEALYLEIFKSRLIEITLEINGFDQLELNPGEKLRGYLLLYIQRISSNKSFHRLLYNQLATRRHPAVIEMVTEARVQIYRFLLKIIQSGIDSGHFKAIDAEIFALNILSFIPSVFTGNLSSLMHLYEPVRDDMTGRMIDHILLMVIPEKLTSINLSHV
ncbi:TetR/AcrR family transcriptional regulator [Mucilaginibacter sp. ZT4R22]|uniref:TetR/AcrR family transcriptional regulator n=1 Tax=Mucilaginibacter pankratovii TaxID=2772110 RepID=A0ABR7WJW1_9SPHI|nr:TetR/AcrR family transcriptional regulator [Mucilaginibacter pankratovii]MBD1362605.1 TetR/AcrR family transcriptional regulator [Mucilaginibacter pankratovii]